MKHQLAPCFSVFVAIGLFLQSFSIYATNYYISAAGSNANNGKSSALPWQTIAKVNASMSLFQPGDSILFRRGDIFRDKLVLANGTTGNASARLVFGAYGTGAKPVISGAVAVSGWVAQTINGFPMFTASFSQNPKHLFVDGKQMVLGRMENYGPMTGTGSSTTIVASALPAWAVGATVHVRVQNDGIETKTIVAVSGATATVSPSDFLSTPSAGYGYILENKLELVDTPGEWFYNTTTQTLYLYPPVGINPTQATTLVEASVKDRGIEFFGTGIHGSNYLVFQNLEITKQTQTGIFSYNTEHTTITNCQISCAGEVGLEISGAPTQNIIVTNCAFERNNSSHLSLNGLNSLVSNNTFDQNFWLPGLAKSGLIPGLAVNLGGTSCVFRYNTISNSGYHGVFTLGYQHLLEYNHIFNCGLVKNDLGGIYAWENWNTDPTLGSYATIRGNIVHHVTGNVSGTPAGNGPIAKGIYLDDGCRFYQILNNTTYDCTGHGIFIQSCQNTTIQGNTVYGCEEGQFQISNKPIAFAPNVVSTVVENNIFYSLKDSQLTMDLTSGEAFNNFGTYNNNYYLNPYGHYLINQKYTGFEKKMELPRWQGISGFDAGSKISRFRLDGHTLVYTSANLKPNPTFDTNTNNYTAASWTNSSATHVVSGSPLDGGCLKITRTNPGNFSVEGRDLPAFEVGQTYFVSFSALANTTTDIEISGRKQDPNWDYYNNFNYKFPIGTTRRAYSTIITNQITHPGPARMDFAMGGDGSHFFIDNVVVRKVTATPVNARAQNPIFVNSTNAAQTFLLPGSYFDIDSVAVVGSITLAPFTSKILIKVSDCVDYTVATVPNYPNGTAITLKAPNTITAANSIGTNASVTYQAGKSITLLPGFKVEKTTVFRAQLGGCN
jgi:parallel beta-helix repeat protein